MADIVIIGAGPAGISAALYAVRAGFETIVVSLRGGSLFKTDKIENYYGFPEAVSGQTLYRNGTEEAKRLGVKLIESEVVGIGFADGFSVVTTEREILCRSIVIATGTKRKKPPVNGLSEYEGRGVSYCAVCDAFFYRQKDVAVLGSSKYALHEAEVLSQVAASVTIFTNGEKTEIKGSRFKVITEKVAGLYGDETLGGLLLSDGTRAAVSGLFVAYGTAGSEELARKMGILTQNGNVVIDENGETNIHGIFAAGDCTGGLLQISKAVYEGARAGLSAIKFLRN